MVTMGLGVLDHCMINMLIYFFIGDLLVFNEEVIIATCIRHSKNVIIGVKQNKINQSAPTPWKN